MIPLREEFNVWLSDEPLTTTKSVQLMRTVERRAQLEGNTLVQFLPEQRPEETPQKTERVHATASKRFADTRFGRQERRAEARMPKKTNPRP